MSTDITTAYSIASGLRSRGEIRAAELIEELLRTVGHLGQRVEQHERESAYAARATEKRADPLWL